MYSSYLMLHLEGSTAKKRYLTFFQRYDVIIFKNGEELFTALSHLD